ncbi:MAG: hypothetical protein IJ853_02995 [Rickettsiales bacterium]|nr:hypothetical protein [Rickettsiales bacterium]
MKKVIVIGMVAMAITACGPTMKAERLTTAAGDEKALTVTNEWVATDTDLAVKYIVEKLPTHRRYLRYLSEHGNKTPKIFIGEVENQTSEDNFPIQALNNKLLNEFFDSGEFDLISVKDRDRILKEIKYQNSGMVKQSDIKSIGKASGADLILSGEVVMEDKRLGGKTLKEYSLSIRLTDIESGEEVSRALYETTKYSKQKKFSL